MVGLGVTGVGLADPLGTQFPSMRRWVANEGSTDDTLVGAGVLDDEKITLPLIVSELMRLLLMCPSKDTTCVVCLMGLVVSTHVNHGFKG